MRVRGLVDSLLSGFLINEVVVRGGVRISEASRQGCGRGFVPIGKGEAYVYSVSSSFIRIFLRITHLGLADAK